MITNAKIEQYFYGLLPPRDELLTEMEGLAAKRDIPIVGPAVATLLAQLVRISGAKRIFELGSAIGYSTIWLARAAGPGAEVHYTDGDPVKAFEAEGYFKRAKLSRRVHVHVGDALQSLEETPGKFDFIFNDVDKEGYPAVLSAAASRLKIGGLFVTDNTLYHEKVLRPKNPTALGVVEFNRRLFASERFESCLVPLRDGVTISVKVR
jgi:predicted O-methyltransferase YrrM